METTANSGKSERHNKGVCEKQREHRVDSPIVSSCNRGRSTFTENSFQYLPEKDTANPQSYLPGNESLGAEAGLPFTDPIDDTSQRESLSQEENRLHRYSISLYVESTA